MLSRRLVLPERYGPHSATTRCAPLPGLPPVMVSDLMSAMTTSSCWRGLLRTKAPDVVATELGRSEVLSWKSFHPGLGESIRGCGEGGVATVITAELVAGRSTAARAPPSCGYRRPWRLWRHLFSSQWQC